MFRWQGPAFRHPAGAPTVAGMAPLPNPPAEPADDLDSYVGLAGEAAERRARERGWTTVRSLPKGAIITMEYLTGRLNFTVEDGVVARCWKG